MLVPTPRFLFWFAGIVLPFSALGALYSEAQWATAILIAGLLLAAAIDAALATRQLDAFTLELPPLIRLSLQRSATVELIITHPAGPTMPLRLGLEWPTALKVTTDEQTVRLPADTERCLVTWNLEPVQRGKFHVHRARLETPSRLGFWGVRRTVPVQCEVRIYPNLQRDRKQLAALFLNRGAMGLHAQRQIGKGRDFEKLREYIAGDSYDEIHWKATAKRHHPVTKIFQIERTQEIYVVLDNSRLSARRKKPDTAPLAATTAPAAATTAGVRPPTGNETESDTLERFIQAALILAQAAERQGDLFGLITFSSQPGTFLRASHGHAHYAACRDALYTLHAENVSPDFDEIVSFLRTRLRRRALLVFLTSLDDPVLAETFTRNMALLARQHLVLVNQILPDGVAPLFHRAEDVTELDDLYRHLGGHLQWQRLQELQRILQHRGVRLSLLEHEHLATELVSQYLGVKQRQLI